MSYSLSALVGEGRDVAGKIFINYRREDDPGYALALYARLQIEFGQQALFMDVEGGFRAGEDFVAALDRRVAECDTLLAVIGPRWLTVADGDGRRRIDKREDFVRVGHQRRRF
jgi:hypothetical protein